LKKKIRMNNPEKKQRGNIRCSQSKKERRIDGYADLGGARIAGRPLPNPPYEKNSAKRLTKTVQILSKKNEENIELEGLTQGRKNGARLKVPTGEK